MTEGERKIPNPRLTIDHEELLKDQEFTDLFMRGWNRNHEIIDANLEGDDYEQAIGDFLTKREADENAVLQTPEQRYRYEYFKKFKDHEISRPQLDPGAYEILVRLDYLPVMPVYSCTGHVIEGTDELEKDEFIALGFVCDFETTQEDIDLQLEFLNGINELNRKIAEQHFGGEPLAYFQLTGDYVDWGEDGVQQLTLQETIDQHRSLLLYINVPDMVISQEHGKEILVIMWQEFIDYLKSLDQRDLPDPDFQNGEIFVRKN